MGGREGGGRGRRGWHMTEVVIEVGGLYCGFGGQGWAVLCLLVEGWR